MILTEKVEIKASNQNFDYYKNLGYDVEFGKELLVSINHLPMGSHYVILARCDRCGKERSIQYRGYKGYCPQCNSLVDLAERLDKLDDFSEVTIRPLRKYFIYCSNNTCSICGNKIWDNQEIPLILDHIDGNSSNWTRTNLRVVCPNCDALLPTWKGRNRGNGRLCRRTK